MTETPWTNGPWAAQVRHREDDADTWNIWAEQTCIVTGLRNEANARLIAAAPEMAELLKRIAAKERSITTDVSTAHKLRGPGASEWMTEDDRDMRLDLDAFFSDARALLHSITGEHS